MSQRDYYEVLGVQREADQKEIKRAYRKLAMDFHPDRNKSDDAETKFKEASEAYEVLSDTNKRALYDQHGFAGLKDSGFSGFSGMGVEDIFSSFGDVFGDFFGQQRGDGGRRRGGQRGSDLRADLSIGFDEAVFGCTKEVKISQQIACDACSSSGAARGSAPTTCPTCRGQGEVMHGQGLFLIRATCPDCAGRGQVNSQTCGDCNGEGTVSNRRTINVTIPAGFDDGMSLRYAGAGNAGVRGGGPGDLYIRVNVREHETLQRRGDDLVTEIAIGIAEAALGTEIEVKGADGVETVPIPRGTQPGDVFTLKKKGVPRLRGSGRGNLHVVIRVEVPTKLSSKQKKLLQEFASLSDKSKKRRLF